jgi:hypothetical protein
MTADADDRMAMRLDALLRDQRIALREGRMDALADIAPRLAKLLQSMSAPVPHGMSREQAARLKHMASENARLLRAAIAGLAEARQMRRGAHGIRLNTYDATGRLAKQVTTGTTLARR